MPWFDNNTIQILHVRRRRPLTRVRLYVDIRRRYSYHFCFEWGRPNCFPCPIFIGIAARTPKLKFFASQYPAYSQAKIDRVRKIFQIWKTGCFNPDYSRRPLTRSRGQQTIAESPRHSAHGAWQLVLEFATEVTAMHQVTWLLS